MIRRDVLLYSLFFAVVVLSVVPFVRFLFFDSLFPSSEPYHHLLIAKSAGLSMPYHYLLSLHPLVPFFIGPLLGLFSVVLCFFVLDKLGFRPLHSFTALLILVSSPAFIYLFSVPNPYSLSVFFVLLGYLLFLYHPFASFFPFAFAVFFHPLNLVFILFIILAHSVNFSISFPRYLFLFLSLVFLFFHVSLFANFHDIVVSPNPLVSSVSDLGGLYGFGIFAVLLSFLGLYNVWLSKKQLVPYSLLFIVVLLSFYFPFVNLFLNFLLSFFAAYGFMALVDMKWRIAVVRSLTVFLLVCGIVFSSLAYLNFLSGLPPSPSFVSSLEELQSQPYGVVFSHPKNSFFINYFADKPVLPDSFFFTDDADSLFFSRNLDTTRSLLEKYNISYVVVDSGMTHGLVWSDDGQGLLFLFRNSKTFKNLYSSDDLDIWLVR